MGRGGLKFSRRDQAQHGFGIPHVAKYVRYRRTIVSGGKGKNRRQKNVVEASNQTIQTIRLFVPTNRRLHAKSA